MSLRVKDSGYIKTLPHFAFDLTVGVHAEDGDARHGKGPLTVGQVAAISEFGSSAANIPARNWLRGWLAKQERAVVRSIRSNLAAQARRQVFRQEPFQVIAERMQATVVGRILGGQIRPANAPQTLANKAPEGRPLVETKQFEQAIHAKLEGKGPLTWKHKA